MTQESAQLTDEGLETRRQNLAFVRENKPGEPDDDHTFVTTLVMQEQWLATVDADRAKITPLLAALEAVEWRGEPVSGQRQRTCPSCDVGRRYGHSSRCKLALAIKKARA